MYMMDHRVFPRVVRVGWPEKVVPSILNQAYSSDASLNFLGMLWTLFIPGVGTKTSNLLSQAASTMSQANLLGSYTFPGYNRDTSWQIWASLGSYRFQNWKSTAS